MPVQDFLNQRAVNIIVGGSYTLPNWYDSQGKLRTFACRTTRVSPFRMIVEVPVVGKIGDRLTSYFREFGKFEGSISDTMERSFLLELEMVPRPAREAFGHADLAGEEAEGCDDQGRQKADARFVPPDPHSTVTLADGSIHPCFIVDFSASGVAVSAARAASGRHAARGRNLHRPRRPVAAQRLRASSSSSSRIGPRSRAADRANCGAGGGGRSGPGPAANSRRWRRSLTFIECGQAASNRFPDPSSRPAATSASRMRAISGSLILTSGGRTTARGSRPSSTSASFMRLCMSTKGSA